MKGTKFFGILALAACLAAPSIAGAVCPAAATYFFAGSGVTTYLATPGVFTSNWPAPSTGLPGIPVAFDGQFTSNQGISCATGCPRTATAAGVATQVALTSSTNVPNVAGGGFDGIACDTTFTLALTADCDGATLEFIDSTSTTATSVPTAGGTTPAAVCGGLIGSTLDTQAVTIGSSQQAFNAVVTHNVGCTSGNDPCTLPQDQFTDIVSFNGDLVENNNF